jgi:predicted secreted protein
MKRKRIKVYSSVDEIILKDNSKKAIFVSECILNQGIRAEGVKNKTGDGPSYKIIKTLLDYNIGITVIPCPEIKYEGLYRKTARKIKYDNPIFRGISESISDEVVLRIKEYQKNNYKVIGILGLNGSPSCAINFCYKDYNKGKVNEPGVLMEVLKKKLRENNLTTNFIGVENYNIEKTLFQIKEGLK